MWYSILGQDPWQSAFSRLSDSINITDEQKLSKKEFIKKQNYKQVKQQNLTEEFKKQMQSSSYDNKRLHFDIELILDGKPSLIESLQKHKKHISDTTILSYIEEKDIEYFQKLQEPLQDKLTQSENLQDLSNLCIAHFNNTNPLVFLETAKRLCLLKKKEDLNNQNYTDKKHLQYEKESEQQQVQQEQKKGEKGQQQVYQVDVQLPNYNEIMSSQLYNEEDKVLSNSIVQLLDVWLANNFDTLSDKHLSEFLIYYSGLTDIPWHQFMDYTKGLHSFEFNNINPRFICEIHAFSDRFYTAKISNIMDRMQMIKQINAQILEMAFQGRNQIDFQSSLEISKLFKGADTMQLQVSGFVNDCKHQNLEQCIKSLKLLLKNHEQYFERQDFQIIQISLKDTIERNFKSTPEEQSTTLLQQIKSLHEIVKLNNSIGVHNKEMNQIITTQINSLFVNNQMSASLDQNEATVELLSDLSEQGIYSKAVFEQLMYIADLINKTQVSVSQLKAESLFCILNIFANTKFTNLPKGIQSVLKQIIQRIKTPEVYRNCNKEVSAVIWSLSVLGLLDIDFIKIAEKSVRSLNPNNLSNLESYKLYQFETYITYSQRTSNGLDDTNDVKFLQNLGKYNLEVIKNKALKYQQWLFWNNNRDIDMLQLRCIVKNLGLQPYEDSLAKERQFQFLESDNIFVDQNKQKVAIFINYMPDEQASIQQQYQQQNTELKVQGIGIGSDVLKSQVLKAQEIRMISIRPSSWDECGEDVRKQTEVVIQALKSNEIVIGLENDV